MIINKVKKLIKMIIKTFIIFQTLLLLAYIEKYLDRYPIIKKNKNKVKSNQKICIICIYNY